MKRDRLREHTFISSFDKNSVIVDLGAHRGEFSKLFAEKYNFGRMILVEANPNLIDDIKKNMTGFKNVEIMNVIMGKKDGNDISFYLSNIEAASSLNKDFSNGKFAKNGLRVTTEIKIKRITFSNLLKSNKIYGVNLLKIDIEGAEWDLVENFTRDDYSKTEQISVEFHDFYHKKFRNKTEKCIDKLKKLGYHFTCRGTKFEYGSPYYDCLFYKKSS